jgi:hypothetical protein
MSFGVCFVIFSLITTGKPPFVAISFTVPQQQETEQFGREVWDSSRQYLTPNGRYLLSKKIGTHTEMPFPEAHRRLIPLGTFMLVKTRSLSQFGINGPKRWVRGSLRYPEEDRDDMELCIFVTVVVKTRPGVELDIRIVHVAPEDCLVMEGSGVREQDITTEVIRQNVQMPVGNS